MNQTLFDKAMMAFLGLSFMILIAACGLAWKAATDKPVGCGGGSCQLGN